MPVALYVEKAHSWSIPMKYTRLYTLVIEDGYDQIIDGEVHEEALMDT